MSRKIGVQWSSIMANLVLRNQTKWPGFLWYLADPSTEVCVHKLSIANPLKIVNISFCSLLFVDPLKFQEHIGINVASLRVKTGAFP